MRERVLSIYLPNHNLLYTDKTGMAAGVEARVPPIDIKMTERVSRYPTAWLLRSRETTSILRHAASGILPRSLLTRRKAGFIAPFRKWLRYDLADTWNELTSEQSIRSCGWFEYDAVRNIRSRSQAGKEDLYMLQWAIVTIELWARQFIDDNPGMQQIA
jgi:asparagine synthase (glutamine-hydrolysing)